MVPVLLVALHFAYVLSFGTYQAPGPGDTRGPCPMVQALANHGEINRDGTFNKEQLIQALDRVAGECTGQGKVTFNVVCIRDPQLNGLPGPPNNWVFNQAQMNSYGGGDRDGNMAHTDAIFGDITLFNATKWAKTISFSSDGKTMGLWDLYKAQQYHLAQSNIDNKRTDPAKIAAHNEFGVGNIAFIWMLFGQKNISIPDLTTFMSGRLPDNFVRPKPWCRRDWLQVFFTMLTGGKVYPDDLLLYLLCKQTVAGIVAPDSYICEFEFSPHVTALNTRSLAPPVNALLGKNIPLDPGTKQKALQMGRQFPYDIPDEKCSMDEPTLLAARLAALKDFFRITGGATGDYAAYEKELSPLFLDAPTTRFVNNAAGIFESLKIVIEYVALTVPGLNNGFAWFGPPLVNQETFKYWQNNATIMIDTSRLAAFVCKDLPIVNPQNLEVVSDGACETPLLRVAQTTMITFVPCSTVMKQFLVAFDDGAEKQAILGFNYFRTCWYHDRYCLGSNRQYDSFASCVEFMNSIPRKTCSWLLQGNSQSCRGLHAFLAKLDPDTHCNHIGPNSNTCNDQGCVDLPDGSLLCEDYPAADIRYDSLKSEKCPAEPASSSVIIPNLILALLSFSGVFSLFA